MPVTDDSSTQVIALLAEYVPQIELALVTRSAPVAAVGLALSFQGRFINSYVPALGFWWIVGADEAEARPSAIAVDSPAGDAASLLAYTTLFRNPFLMNFTCI